MHATATESTEKLCTKCSQLHPIEMFRLRSRTSGDRMHHCRDCRRIDDQFRRLARQERHDRRQIRSIYDALAEIRTQQAMLTAIQQFITQLGGPIKFAKLLARYVESELAHKSSRRRLDAMRISFRVFELANQLPFHRVNHTTK